MDIGGVIIEKSFTSIVDIDKSYQLNVMIEEFKDCDRNDTYLCGGYTQKRMLLQRNEC